MPNIQKKFVMMAYGGSFPQHGYRGSFRRRYRQKTNCNEDSRRDPISTRRDSIPTGSACRGCYTLSLSLLVSFRACFCCDWIRSQNSLTDARHPNLDLNDQDSLDRRRRKAVAEQPQHRRDDHDSSSTCSTKVSVRCIQLEISSRQELLVTATSAKPNVFRVGEKRSADSIG